MNNIIPTGSSFPETYDLIDKGYFEGWKERDIANWYRTNIKELLAAIRSELEKLFAIPVDINRLPDSLHEYSAKADLIRLQKAVKKQNPYPQRLLSGIAAATLIYPDCSCHKILFRTDEKVYLPNNISDFLKLVKESSRMERRAAEDMLSSGTEELYDVLYVLKLRLLELADEVGCDYNKLLCNVSVHSAIRLTTNALFDDISSIWSKPVDGIKERDQELLKNYVLTVIVYSICTIYNISADRLLLHDYSRLACHPDGTELTAEEQTILSLFLRANIKTQSEVIGYMIALHSRSQRSPLILST